MLSTPTESDVVQIWLSNPIPLTDAVQRVRPEAGTLLGDLEAILKRIRDGAGDADTVSREAEIIANRIKDPRLRSLFLTRWAQWAGGEIRFTEAESLIRRALETLPKDAPIECFAQAHSARAYIVFWKGDLIGHRKLFRGVVEKYPRQSPRWLRVLGSLASDLGEYGRLAELSEWPRKGERAGLDQGTLALLNPPDFCNAVQTGALEQARALAPSIKEIPRDISQSVPLLRHHLAFLELQEGLWTSFRPTTVVHDLLARNLLEVLHRLIQGKPQEALAYARTLEIDSKDIVWAQYGWTTLLRAELACGNHLAAKRLLDKERERSGEHYLDDLFLARMERLAGHPEEAQKHFSRLLERIAFYKAEGRLDFELKMACELSPHDVFKWTRTAKPIASPAPLPAASRPEPAPSTDAPLLIGTSPAMKDIRKLIRDVASHKAPVLITGETGTGKDLVARGIHYEGARKKEPFLAVNCSGITESLLSSELFGHVKGAFTGAERDRPGLFEQAGKGTLFLDEIGDISPGLQVALLRVLDQGEIRPVGADRDRKIQCRIVAATNADLEAKVKAGTFREDLLFRLQRLTIHIPPLRERRQDLKDLAAHFLNEGRPEGMHASLSDDLSTLFAGHAWPGNIREFKNTIERMRVLNSDGLHYGMESLDRALAKRFRTLPPAPVDAASSPAPAPEAHRQDAAAPTDAVRNLIESSRSPLRRRERIKGIFREYKTLTLAEVKAATGVSAFTVIKDLKALCVEGFLRKVEHSHYYTLR